MRAREWRSRRRHRARDQLVFGARFTCFTGIKAQILTQKAPRTGGRRQGWEREALAKGTLIEP
jgi:hypothetical protein